MKLGGKQGCIELSECTMEDLAPDDNAIAYCNHCGEVVFKTEQGKVTELNMKQVGHDIYLHCINCSKMVGHIVD